MYIYGECAKALSIVMCEKVWCYKISANVIGCSTFCPREFMVYLGLCVLLLKSFYFIVKLSLSSPVNIGKLLNHINSLFLFLFSLL